MGNPGSIPGFGKIPWSRDWLPTPVLLSGEFHGQSSLAGYSHGVATSQTLSNYHLGFSNGSAGRESTYNAGDTGDAGSIPE